MKKIDTSAITSGSWMPVLGNYKGNNFVNSGSPDSFAGLDFLQQAYAECINALSQFIVNDQSVPTVFYTVPPPPPPSNIFTFAEISLITQGYMYYQGEIYYFSFSDIVALPRNSGRIYQNANIVTSYSGADPVTFSDSSIHNVHGVSHVQFSWSGIRNAGNIPDYDLWLNATNNSYASVLAQTTLNAWINSTYTPFVTAYNANVNPTVIQVVAPGYGTPAFQSGWTNSIGIPQHSGNYPNPLSFYIMWNRVYIWGEITHPGVAGKSTIFTLPAGYCPMAVEEVFEVWNTGLQNVAGGNNETPPYYLVITSGGLVQLLSNTTPAARNITLSGISFTQGDYVALTEVSYYTDALADIEAHTDEYAISETSYTFSDDE